MHKERHIVYTISDEKRLFRNEKCEPIINKSNKNLINVQQIKRHHKELQSAQKEKAHALTRTSHISARDDDKVRCGGGA